VEAQDNQHNQPQYRIPVREHVPMEVREARSSRFVSLLAGATALVKLPKLSKAQRLWLRGVRQEEALRREAGAVEDSPQWMSSARLGDLMNPQRQD